MSDDKVMEYLLEDVVCVHDYDIIVKQYRRRTAIATLNKEREVASNRIKELESKLEIREAELRQARMDIEIAQWRRDG